MRFVRIAAFEFSRLGRIIPPTAVGYGQVTVDISCAPGQVPAQGKDVLSPAVYLATATTALNADALTRSAFLHIDPEMRRKCEIAIEATANAIAVSNACSRAVQSLRPYFFLAPDNEEDARALETLQYPVLGRRVPKVLTHTGIDLFDSPRLLGDRSGGATLLAEALSNSNALGRFRDFVRLFELAFHAEPKALPPLLVAFLKDADLGYTEAEIGQWLLVRDPASHADMKWPGSWIAFERDATPFIDRMEQAATDVLLNKEVWSDPSVQRRSVWDPKAATLSPEGGLRLTEGEHFEVSYEHTVDCFNAWSVRGSAVLKPQDGSVRNGSISEQGALVCQEPVQLGQPLVVL